jgi:predicted nucleotidyltransferase
MKPMEQTEWYKEFGDRSILIGYRGSQSHGTYRPPVEECSVDDVDVCGITIGPIEYYLGFGGQQTYERMEGDRSTAMVWDLVCWDLRHFFDMLSHSNPNAMAMLWIEKSHYLKLTPAGKLLVDNRDIFSSKQAH